MDVVSTLVVALITLGCLGSWYYALWRGFHHATGDQSRTERRVAVSGLAILLAIPITLAVAGASDFTAVIAIAIAMAAVLPLLIFIGARDHRRREGRIRARRHGNSDAE